MERGLSRGARAYVGRMDRLSIIGRMSGERRTPFTAGELLAVALQILVDIRGKIQDPKLARRGHTGGWHLLAQGQVLSLAMH